MIILQKKQIKRFNNYFFYIAGLIILVLNKIRHTLTGYTTPRPFPVSEIEKAIEYDYTVTNRWQEFLHSYAHTGFEGKNILELGPGADLGVGLILLARGARNYKAVDVHNLISLTPSAFYAQLLLRIQHSEGIQKISDLEKEIDRALTGHGDQLQFIHDKKFTFSDIEKSHLNLVVSNAAFEHFNSVKNTIKNITSLVKSNGFLCIHVDLQTHTRWIRDADPLNIYRYSKILYRLMAFKETPNRVRPHQYINALKENGWKNIQLYPTISLDEDYTASVVPQLNRKYRRARAEMNILEMVICATKK